MRQLRGPVLLTEGGAAVCPPPDMQVQRLALARALATDAELLVADDVSSALDARTGTELWEAPRRRGVTVVGASSERSALAWSELVDEWGHLAG